jgi:hypothetical protein
MKRSLVVVILFCSLSAYFGTRLIRLSFVVVGGDHHHDDDQRTAGIKDTPVLLKVSDRTHNYHDADQELYLYPSSTTTVSPATSAQQQQQQQQHAVNSNNHNNETDVLAASSTLSPSTTVLSSAGLLSNCGAMLIKNKKDYHYEVLESIVIKYPLPWERLLPSNCSRRKNRTNSNIEVQVDFALTSHPNNVDSALDGFKEYFVAYLHNKTFRRDDGIWIRYRDLVSYRQDYDSQYDVEVSASPGSNARFVQWLKQSPSHFCVLHRDLGPVQKSPHNLPTVLNQSCWLNPMFSPRCFFIPTVLPKFDKKKDLDKNTTTIHNDTIILCTSGSNRDHSILAEALNVILHSGNDNNNNHYTTGSIQVHVLGRTTLDYEGEYERYNVSLPIPIKHPSYIEYHKDVIRYDILLPLISPETHPQYFNVPTKKGSPNRKLTGVMSQIIGYEKPSVVHTELFQVYGDSMKPDHRKLVFPYTNRTEFISGLKRLIVLLREHQHQKRQQQQQQQQQGQQEENNRRK